MERKSSFQAVHSNETGTIWNKAIQHNLRIFMKLFCLLGKQPNRNDDDQDLVQRLGKSGAVIIGVPSFHWLVTYPSDMHLR